MSDLRLTTAGESHGPYEVCILEGIPAGLRLTVEDVDKQLMRRQKGYGRGGRMAIESDRCEFGSGVRLGTTIGSPVSILVQNKDHENWRESMGAAPATGGGRAREESTVPRPGHADFAGMVKSGHSEIRPVLERASARETVARVAGGAVCRRVLEELGVRISARVVSIGGAGPHSDAPDYATPDSVDWGAAESSPVGCEDGRLGDAMCSAIDKAKQRGESLGGVFEVWAWGVCPGLGDNTRYYQRLDARLLSCVGSIPAIKGVEIGPAFTNATLPGSEVHDEFVLQKHGSGKGLTRASNRAGGIEGGLSNGMPIVIRAAMKPIPTLTRPLRSVDLEKMAEAPAHVERSDVTAVPAARVVAEAMTAFVLADAYVGKFGGDSMEELIGRSSSYVAGLEERGLWRRS